MEDDLITFETAKLAKEKGFDIPCKNFYYTETFKTKKVRKTEELQKVHDKKYLAPTQSLLQKFIREKRSVHIEIHRNASGYYWSMCKENGGTDLGWSDHKGPNLGGVWDKFEDALEDGGFHYKNIKRNFKDVYQIIL